MWVGNLQDRTLTRVDPETRTLAATLALAATPTDVAATPGAVWVVHGQLGTVSRVDSTFNRVTADIDPDVGRSTGGGIASGSSGVWVTLAGHAISYVGRIDPVSDEITVSGNSDGRPAGIAVGRGCDLGCQRRRLEHDLAHRPSDGFFVGGDHRWTGSQCDRGGLRSDLGRE